VGARPQGEAASPSKDEHRQAVLRFHSRSAPRLAGPLVDTGRRSDLWRSSHTLRAHRLPHPMVLA
jgi:hypothetical protein